MKHFTLLFLTITSVICTPFAFAGNRDGAITLTAGAGLYSFATSRHLNDAAAIPLLSLAYNFDRQWAVEGSFAPMHTRFDTGLGEGSVNGNLYMLSGIYRFFKQGMLEPYASAGMGVLYLSPNGTNSNNQANVNLGLGMQAFFDDSIALRGEVRDLYTLSHGRNDVMFSIGVSFLFGGNQVVIHDYKNEIVHNDL